MTERDQMKRPIDHYDKVMQRVRKLKPEWGPLPKTPPSRPQFPSKSTIDKIYRKGHHLLRCDDTALTLDIVRPLRTWYDGIFVEVAIHPRHKQDYDDYCHAELWQYFRGRKQGETFQQFHKRKLST